MSVAFLLSRGFLSTTKVTTTNLKPGLNSENQEEYLAGNRNFWFSGLAHFDIGEVKVIINFI